MSDETAQHPFSIYIKIWILLFILSTFSYLVDFFEIQGYLRWTLVMIFMLLKAGFIMAIFMHLQWERLAVKTMIVGVPVVLLVLVGFMALEGEYTNDARVEYFSESDKTFIRPHGFGDH